MPTKAKRTNVLQLPCILELPAWQELHEMDEGAVDTEQTYIVRKQDTAHLKAELGSAKSLPPPHKKTKPKYNKCTTMGSMPDPLVSIFNRKTSRCIVDVRQLSVFISESRGWETVLI